MRRRGAILVVVLVCLAIAAVLFVMLAKQAITERRAVQNHYWGVQAQWLAEAGVERAVSRLAANADYSGETWNISADELSGSDAAVVRIRAEKTADRPDRRTIHVEADYPDDPQHRCRKTKDVLADITGK
jgi:type II secretory pathway component PulK